MSEFTPSPELIQARETAATLDGTLDAVALRYKGLRSGLLTAELNEADAKVALGDVQALALAASQSLSAVARLEAHQHGQPSAPVTAPTPAPATPEPAVA